MSKDNMAFRKYGIRPAAEWERWHDANDHFPNGTVPNAESAPAAASEAVDIATKNANMAVKIANISKKLANGATNANRAEVAVAHAQDAVRERNEAAQVARSANAAADRGDHHGAANAAVEALCRAQNAAQYAQLTANAAGAAGTPPLVVESTMQKARDLHERAQDRKFGLYAAIRRYMERIRAALA